MRVRVRRLNSSRLRKWIDMAKLPVNKIRDLGLKIIAENPGGIRYGALVKKISTANPETPTNTIHGSVWDLATRFPDKVVKPSRGLFKPAGADNAVQQAPTALTSKMKEEDFYEPFAEYLKNDLDEVTTVASFGGAGLKGKWGTPRCYWCLQITSLEPHQVSARDRRCGNQDRSPGSRGGIRPSGGVSAVCRQVLRGNAYHNFGRGFEPA